MKRALNERTPGGYNRDRFVTLINDAVNNYSKVDRHSEH